MTTTAPHGLSEGGSALWQAVTSAHSLDAVQRVTLLEACRAKDRLDRLDTMARDGTPWQAVTLPDESPVELHLDAGALVNRTADVLKQLLASLRLPDSNGRRPQRRGTSRGVYRKRD